MPRRDLYADEYLAVSQHHAAATFTEYMRITNAGNVGINITSPAYALDVAGQTRSCCEVGAVPMNMTVRRCLSGLNINGQEYITKPFLNKARVYVCRDLMYLMHSMRPFRMPVTSLSCRPATMRTIIDMMSTSRSVADGCMQTTAVVVTSLTHLYSSICKLRNKSLWRLC